MKAISAWLGMASRKGAALFLLGSAFLRPVQAADPFAEGVRSTDPLTPAQEQKSFHLHPGFEIQLVASDPDIFKPMNMAFDARGRLWVTVTREYPYAVPLDKKGRDSILVMEDNDNDGRADKITTFADGLNIPTGIYPYEGGVIAWSIPNLWHFQDTDGDGVADRREVLYGPFGYERDTHGMNSSFRRGFDGWLYATHGYNNISSVTARDGSSVKMQSGNTYRVRTDGARIEQHTWGQVNPFGLCFDPLGNLYSADCHSSPIYQLLAGGYYPSFGKPDDGLGFAPITIQHSHGSTAIAGVLYYADDLFPQEFQGNLFVGNVMTSRVNRDELTDVGTSRIGREMPDFIRADDPWFRPVDLQLGPDGAVYIADFYNRIIGHYEVPLAHPGRDRTSGRIWRVVYRGEDGTENARPRRDLSGASAAGLIRALADPNLTYRMLAMNQLVDRIGEAAVDPVGKMLEDEGSSPFQVIHGLWVLQRLHALLPEFLSAAARHPDRGVRTHAMRILADTASLSPQFTELALKGLNDGDGFVRRSAAEALADHPAQENITPLLRLRQRVPEEDTHTLYVARKALRDQLKEPSILARTAGIDLSEADSRSVADVLLSIGSPEAGAFLLRHVQAYSVPGDTLAAYLRHIARHIAQDDLPELAGFVRRRFPDDLDFQLALFTSVDQGLQQRGSTLPPALASWGGELANRLFASTEQEPLDWVHHPVEGLPPTANPWVIQQRASADGDGASPFLCSLPSGEQLTGVLRSKTFIIPAQLNFFLAGHDGFPDNPPQKKNVVRLRDERTDATLAEVYPPRNDTAQRVSWDLEKHLGKRAYLEITDADSAQAYAWLAVGRFDPTVVRVPHLDPSTLNRRRIAAAEWASKLGLHDLEPTLNTLVGNTSAGPDARAAAAQALLALDAKAHLPTLQAILNDGSAPFVLREKIGRSLGRQDSPEARPLLLEAIKTAPQRLQIRLAQALASHPAGAEALLQSIAEGKLPPVLLLERAVKDTLLAAKPTDATARLESLTKNITPPDENRGQLLEKLRRGYPLSRPSTIEGQLQFTKNCAVCHQIGGQGGLIGPQLDGIGNRGLERLVEDVIDPNRNVDQAFRSSLLILKDGDVVSGLFRREEGELIILAESTGKEISVPRPAVAERRESETSLMPENFGEILTPDDFNHLMAYLLSQKTR